MTDQLLELRKQPHWSFSSINLFLNCSLQWAFRYLFRIAPESTSVSLLFGSAFHRTLEFLANKRMSDQHIEPEALQNVFSEAWNNECNSAENIDWGSSTFDKLNDAGRKMVDTLNRSWPSEEILGFSKAFCVQIPGVTKNLIGEIDLIVKDQHGNIVLVDWKSATRKWPEDKADKDLQATCFSYAWTHLTGLIPDFRYDVVTKTKDPSYTQHQTTRTEDDFQRMIHTVQTIERAIQAMAFLPNESSFFCSGCPYTSACKECHRTQAKTISTPKAA